MTPQSYGEVTLKSSNPMDAPKIDPKLLSHPFDRRVAIEGMRTLLNLLEAPSLAKNTVKMIGAPKGRSDEAIWVCLHSGMSYAKLTSEGTYIFQYFQFMASM